MTDTTQTATLANAKPCPFCGGRNLRIEQWYDDEREDFDAVECMNPQCHGAAPIEVWNNRPLEDAANDMPASAEDVAEVATLDDFSVHG